MIVVCHVCCVMCVVCRVFFLFWLPLIVVRLRLLFVVRVYFDLLVLRGSLLFVGCYVLYVVVWCCLLFVVLWICWLPCVVDVSCCSFCC